MKNTVLARATSGSIFLSTSGSVLFSVQAGVDIYLARINPGDDQAVRDWAAQHGIKPEWVRSRKVTLNFESGALATLTDGQGEIPTLMRRRGEDLSLLPTAEL